MLNDDNYNFSFSGIKTSVLYYMRDHNDIVKSRLADIAASFQQAVVDVLVGKSIRAAREYDIRDIVAVGGVSANSLLRVQFKDVCEKQKKRFFSPRPLLSTDNAAMIAMLGALKLERGIHSDLSLRAMARVPL